MNSCRFAMIYENRIWLAALLRAAGRAVVADVSGCVTWK